MFSALYLALLLVLAALMARGVAFEFKGKGDGQRWRRTWTWCTTLGSLLIPLLLGVGLGDLLHGLPIDSNHDFTGDFFDLLTPYGLWTGVTLLGLCLLHGATFLKLRTTEEMRERARTLARPLGWAAIALVVGFVIWTRNVAGGADVPGPVEVLAVIAVVFAARLAMSDSDGWAFAASAVAIAATVGSIFIDLYPHVMVSSTDGAYDLTVAQRRLGSLRAERDDGRRGDPLPDRADLPGLVLPRLPRPCAGAARAARHTIRDRSGDGRSVGRAAGLAL